MQSTWNFNTYRTSGHLIDKHNKTVEFDYGNVN